MWLIKLRSIFWTSPGIAVFTSVMGSISLIISLFSSTGRMQHKVARAWSRSLLWVAGVKVEVEGLDKIAPGGSYVFIANHRSYFDVPVILPHISAQFRFLANKNLFSVPFIGYHLKRAGNLPVDSSNPRDSLRTMSEAARVISERGISILLFPEGGRTAGELAPFKDGAAYIAIKAGVPIVPIGLIGMPKIMPLNSAIISPGHVKMRVGDPIPTLDLTLQDRTRLTQTAYQQVAELLAEELPVAVEH
jgi:1-acyl-sn-glycerol-3-phosphate acyltransferase